MFKGQMLPRMWSQGKTKCVICQINEEQLVTFFYDTTMGVKENYLFAQQLEMKIKEIFGYSTEHELCIGSRKALGGN